MPVSIAIRAKSDVWISKKGARCPAASDAVELPEPACPVDQAIDPGAARARQTEVGFDARCKGSARRLRIEKIGIEPFERVEPVVVAGNRVDRFGKPVERQIEIPLIVLHCAGRIDHVRCHDQEFHGVPSPDLEIAVDQRVLRCVAFAGIADHDEGEIAGLDPGRPDLKQIVARSRMDRPDRDRSWPRASCRREARSFSGRTRWPSFPC